MHRARLLERVAAREALASAPASAPAAVPPSPPFPPRAPQPGARAGAPGLSALIGAPAPPDLLRSVIAHLTRVLNTRCGSVPIDPGFGMRDFGHLDAANTAGDVAELEAQLQGLIEAYEPRLLHPRVRMRREHSDALGLRFDLEAGVLQAGREQPWCLSTRIDPQGRVRIDDAPE